MSEKQIFTLYQVVRYIKKTVEERYSQLYWVKAEMHKLNRYPSGHAFPELVQREEEKIVAQLTGTIWKQQLENINRKFIDVVKEPLKEGTTLLMLVKITFNETFGLSLQILDIDPAYTLGELQRQREETLKRLQREGILNRNQMLTFPILPKRIAVISADSSKGLSDFKQVLDENEESYSFFTFLFPAYLQGDIAVESIIQALRKIKKVQHHFDVVVIVRGGGAEVGMTCYNHYALCKEIALFSLPVLTGIGHSTNMTVAELIAHRNAITPTKLAEFLIQTFREFEYEVKASQKVIGHFSLKLMDQTHQNFNAQIRLFKQMAGSYSKRAMNEILYQQSSLVKNTRFQLLRQQEKIHYFQQNFGHAASKNVKAHQHALAQTQILLKPGVQRLIEKNQSEIGQVENTVRLLSPENVLKRGYSMTLFKGKVISETNQPAENGSIETHTHEIIVHSKVTAIANKKQG